MSELIFTYVPIVLHTRRRMKTMKARSAENTEINSPQTTHDFSSIFDGK